MTALLAEQEYTAALADKPGIVRVLSTGELAEEGDAPYLVLEYVDGPTLTGHVAGQSTDVAHVLTLLGQLAGIVADVHAAGIVHRDIKPENVLVAQREGEVVLKLTDFGLATRAAGGGLLEGGNRLTGDHDRPGTQHYMAPEQCVASEVGTAADIYALGVSAFELLVGEPPWGSRTGREVVIRKCDAALPSFVISDLSLGLPAIAVAAIDAALEREPGLRPTAVGFREAMLAAASEVRARPGAVVMPPVRVPRERAHTPRRPIAAAAMGPATGSGPASATASVRVGRGRMELVVSEVTQVAQLEVAAHVRELVAAPAVARQRRADPERHVDVTELSPRAGAIEVAAEARARSGDTVAVIEVPAVCTAVVDRGVVEQAIVPEVVRPEVVRERQGNAGLRWIAVLGGLSIVAAVVLWRVNETVSADEPGRGDTQVEGGATRPASIAREQARVDPAAVGPSVPARPVEPAVPAPSPMPVSPSTSIEDAPGKAATKPEPIPTPRPKLGKPDVPSPVSSPVVGAVPMHETPACEQARSAVASAASDGNWDAVLTGSKNRKCWSDSSSVAALRVRALLALERHHDCVREGKGFTQRKIAAMVEMCRERSENQ